ncbi:phytanoyl-CoA dioxygenase family protein [Micromonospora sp. NPDC006766]|uniref:phytanoyl-CoA dioxygenase family protein n=1 Tax=Micromonospora sp. NPDC006766 TaxID=3154778 RepID=UPI0033C36D4C
MGLENSNAATALASPLGEDGWQTGLHWGTAAQAAGLAGQLAGRGEVVPRPYETLPEISVLVRAPAIVAAVADVIGPEIALEGGFLLSKPPGGDFRVPWHQDGVNDRIELDPTRSVTVWAALTDATAASGALEVVPGSWRAGYLPYRREDTTGGQRGRALHTDVPPDSPDPVLVPVNAGQALLMDVRLLHRSGSNTTSGHRVGLNLRYVAPGAVTIRSGPSPSLHPVAGASW